MARQSQHGVCLRMGRTLLSPSHGVSSFDVDSTQGGGIAAVSEGQEVVYQCV